MIHKCYVLYTVTYEIVPILDEKLLTILNNCNFVKKQKKIVQQYS